jgi:hypothetical protein
MKKRATIIDAEDLKQTLFRVFLIYFTSKI